MRRLLRPLFAGLLLVPAPLNAQASSDATVFKAAAERHRMSHEASILGEFAGLLGIPNLASDKVNIRRNADRLVEMLQQRGVTASLLEVDGAPPAVFGELRVPGALRTVVLYAHYDGQPVDPSQWATPPWTPTLRTKALSDGGVPIPLPTDNAVRIPGESRIYARSAGDDKATIIAILAALDALRSAGLSSSVNLKFFFEGEEEAGSPHLREMLERHRTVLDADAWLFCDGPNHQTGQQQVLLGVRGVTGLELTVYGPTRPLHSGHYGNWAPNPGAMLANLIASMRDDDGRIKIARFYDDVRAVSASERKAIAASPPVDEELRRSLGLARTEANNAPLPERIMLPALNVRGIQVGAVGDQAANVISTEARASFDFRLVPRQTPERIRDLVNAHIRRQGYFVTEDSVTMAVRLSHPRIARVRWGTGGYPASRAAMDQPFARAVVRAVGDGLGKAPLLLPTMGGSIPAYLFEQVLNKPVIMLPIANYDDNQHAANENLRMQNLWDGINVYAGLFGRLGSYWTPSPVSAGPQASPSGEPLVPGIALATFDSVWTVVARTYVDTAFVANRWSAVRDSLRPRAALVTTREQLTKLISATVGQIPDSHFYVIPANVARDVTSEDADAASGEGTTGASIRIVGDRALVWRVEPGSPAASAGISPGQTVERVRDRITRPAIQRVLALPSASRQRALSELDFKLNAALSGAVGDTVHVRVVRPGESSVTRRNIVAIPVRGTVSKFGNLPPIAGRVEATRIPAAAGASGRAGCVGRIAFNIWLPALAPELQRAIDSVADCVGIVIDVRGNPGGVGGMVMGFGGYFVDTAISLGTMRTRELSLNFVINPRRIRRNGVEGGPFGGPVAILVDPMTASTSEIFATGMQRIGRARVFGERSAGAALPALMKGLPSGDVFVHAVADFTDPAGRRIEGAGVLPDEIIPLTEKDLSRNIDAPLEAAVKWIMGGTAAQTAHPLK